MSAAGCSTGAVGGDASPAGDLGVLADSGGGAMDSGVPASDSGEPASDSGVPGADSGVPASDSGIPASDSGVPASDSGVPAADSGVPASDSGVAPTDSGVASTIPGPSERAIGRGGSYFGFAERFNRYYTDPSWTPSSTLYVSPTGGGTGETMGSPTTVADGFSRVQAGMRIYFLPGTYGGCFELDSSKSGTYDQPIVLYADHTPGTPYDVQINCCNTGRQTCFNFEQADYVAVDGFELIGGRYGVRGVGLLSGSSASHQKGLAVLNSYGHDQNNDPFFTGQSDWVVLDGLLATGGGAGDGHGIYLSNGSDYLIARNIELHSNSSSDFQINADPASTCTDENIPVDDPRCDGPAAMGQGEGVSEYVTLEYNYFHHGDEQGPNFTSVRNSIVRNNVIGFYARHGFSFWQETDNPRLGSSDNQILHNLFISTNNRHALQFIANSDRNLVANNLLLGITTGGAANPSALLLEVDATVTANTWVGNTWVSGMLDGRTPSAQEVRLNTFDPAWFNGFGGAVGSPVTDYRPRSASPLAGSVPRRAELPIDFTGAARGDPTTPGPFEAR
ncbi:MAG: right-handed parallel beta-helix repeat-containing protein [Myxococcota bacterium]